jgi:hypothetical protein
MIVTKHFVFLHIPKTGGTFVTELLRKHLPPEWILHDSPRGQAHTGYRHIPPEFAHLPAICFVRNPWDWYVSWYEWGIQTRREKLPPSIWSKMFGEGANDFKQTIRNCCTVRFEPDSPYRWQELMREQDIDLYSAYYTVVAGGKRGEDRAEVGRSESLREDLLAFMEKHGVPIDSEFGAAVRASPRARTSERSTYQKYYDDELRDLVASYCPLVEKFGYSFDPEPATAPPPALDSSR